MIEADKAKNTWIRICGIYDQTREKKPSETMRSILKEMDYQDVLETFAAITKLKDHDGRISGYNKKAMEQVDTNPACIKIGPGNPLLDSGWIDYIHPTHIDQLIDALLREK